MRLTASLLVGLGIATTLSGCSIYDAITNIDNSTESLYKEDPLDMSTADMPMDTPPDTDQPPSMDCQACGEDVCLSVQSQPFAFCVKGGAIDADRGAGTAEFFSKCLTTVPSSPISLTTPFVVARHPDIADVPVTVTYTAPNTPALTFIGATTSTKPTLPELSANMTVQHISLFKSGNSSDLSTLALGYLCDQPDKCRPVGELITQDMGSQILFEGDDSPVFCNDLGQFQFDARAQQGYIFGELDSGNGCEYQLLKFTLDSGSPNPPMDMGTDMSDMGSDMSDMSDATFPTTLTSIPLTGLTNFSTTSQHGTLKFQGDAELPRLTTAIRLTSNGTYVGLEYQPKANAVRLFNFAPSIAAANPPLVDNCPIDPSISNFKTTAPLIPTQPLFGYTNQNANSRHWLISSDAYKNNDGTHLRLMTEFNQRVFHYGCYPNDAQQRHDWLQDVVELKQSLWVSSNVATTQNPSTDDFQRFALFKAEPIIGTFNEPLFELGDTKNRLISRQMISLDSGDSLGVLGTWTPQGQSPITFLIKLSPNGELLCAPITP